MRWVTIRDKLMWWLIKLLFPKAVADIETTWEDGQIMLHTKLKAPVRGDGEFPEI